MVRTYYNKLVRDTITDLIKQDRNQPKYHIVHDNTEYCNALRAKILEEAIEFKESQRVANS